MSDDEAVKQLLADRAADGDELSGEALALINSLEAHIETMDKQLQMGDTV